MHGGHSALHVEDSYVGVHPGLQWQYEEQYGPNVCFWCFEKGFDHNFFHLLGVMNSRPKRRRCEV